MVRLCLLPMLLLACGEHRHVSKFRMPHGGTCPEDKGCEAPIATEAAYASPDSSRPVSDPSSVSEAVGGVAPARDCAMVAAEIASHEIGDYADDEQRAPVLAKHEARCRSVALTLEERECIVNAYSPQRRSWGQPKDPAFMAYCAPRMFPDQPAVQLVPITSCALVADTIRTRLVQTTIKLDAAQRRVWDAKMEVLATSCKHDRWTTQFGECVQQRSHPVDPMPSCLVQAPYSLQLKVNERITKAMRALEGR